VATFKVEKTGVNKSAAYLLFNKDRELVDVSPSCLQLLGISFDSLHKKQIYYDVQSLFPQLYQDGMPNPAFTNKAGSTITYYFPKIAEYTVSNGLEGGGSDNLRRRGGRLGTDNMGTEGNDEDLKRGGTTGEYT
jgi:hypothetical protein